MPSTQVIRYIRKKDSNRSAYKQRERIIQRSLTGDLNSHDIVFYNDWAAGAYLSEGQNKSRAAMACRKGWVDVFIAEPRDGFHGYFLELKKEGVKTHKKDGTLVAEKQIQKEAAFLALMESKGYKVDFAIGKEDAQRKAFEYLGIPYQVGFDDDIF